MLEEILTLLRESAKVVADSPVAEQALQDVKNVEEIAAKHAKAAEAEVVHWLVSRLHPTTEAPPVA